MNPAETIIIIETAAGNSPLALPSGVLLDDDGTTALLDDDGTTFLLDD